MMTPVFNIAPSRILVTLALTLFVTVAATAQDMSDSPAAETTGAASTESSNEIADSLWERLRILTWRPGLSGACGITGYGTFGRDTELVDHCRLQPFADEKWQAYELEHLR